MIFPYKLFDLTHTLEAGIPAWSTDCGFCHEIKSDYSDGISEVKFRTHTITMDAGMGTHIDAPAHCVAQSITVDDLALTNLLAPCVVVDVAKAAHARFSVSLQDIDAFEKAYGQIKPGSFVMVRTGWEQFWHQPERYRNNHLFPSVSAEAADILLKRQIAGLGIDTLSPDRPTDGYPVHAALLGAGKYIIENAAHLSKLPPIGSFILALPLKIKGATEAPIRLIALIERD